MRSSPGSGSLPAAPSQSDFRPEPVAVAADSPLTVAGAAPVLHRTSLSHRKRHASTQQEEPPPQLLGDSDHKSGFDRHERSAQPTRVKSSTLAGWRTRSKTA